MFIHYRTPGFILKKEDRGEVDQLFTVFTKDFGKLEILGKAIRKISSKLRAGTEIFYLSEIEFVQGKIHKTLTDSILIEKFSSIYKDLRKLRIAYKIAEVLDELVKGQEPDEQIWNLLKETFDRLNHWDIENPKLKIIYYYFLWNFLAILGYQFELYNCALCQKKLLPEKLYFKPKEGGIICQNCLKEGVEISPSVIKILRIILKKNWQTVAKLKIGPDNSKSLESVSRRYFSYVSEIIK